MRSEHLPGTIGVFSLELSRYSSFALSAVSTALEAPTGTDVRWIMGKSIPVALNHLCETFTGEWLWILGDDHEFQPSALTQLLDRQVDVVVPINCQRNKPFAPLLFADAVGDGKRVHRYLWQHLRGKSGLYRLPDHDYCGSAGLLVRKPVFAQLEKPYWQDIEDGTPFSEEIWFCRQLRHAGIEIYVDLDVKFGHTGPACWIPTQMQNGEWVVGLQVQSQPVAILRF